MKDTGWVKIKGFENYMIHETDGVRGPRGGILKRSTHPRGYYMYNLRRGGVGHNKREHRLLWEAFRGPIPAGMQINHIDFNRKNNLLSNLEVVTQEQNHKHSSESGRTYFIQPHLLQNIHTKEIRSFHSYTSAMRILGIGKGNFYKMIKSNGRRSAKGWTVPVKESP